MNDEEEETKHRSKLLLFGFSTFLYYVYIYIRESGSNKKMQVRLHLDVHLILFFLLGSKEPNWWCGHFFFPKDNIPEPAQSDEGTERDLETMRRSEMLEVPWFDLDVSSLKSCLRR